MFEPKYKLWLLKKTLDGYTVVKRKGFSPDDRIVKVRGLGQYDLDIEDVSYRKGRTFFLFKDAITGETLTFFKVRTNISDPLEAETFNATGLVKMALSQVAGDYGLMMMIVVGVMGLFGGIILGQFLPGIFGGGGGSK